MKDHGKKARLRHEVENFEFEFRVPSSFPIQEGSILKISTDNDLGVARANNIMREKRRLKLSTQFPPGFTEREIEEQKIEGDWEISYEFRDSESGAVRRESPIAKGRGTIFAMRAALADADRKFAQESKEEHEQIKCFEMGATATNVHNAQWIALAGMMPQTVKAIQEGDDPRAAYMAEIYLVSGNVPQAADKEIIDLILKIQNHVRGIDIVEKELALGWESKGYNKLGQEIAAVIKEATDLELPVKTIRSICNKLGLVSHSSVHPGAKPKVSY